MLSNTIYALFLILAATSQFASASAPLSVTVEADGATVRVGDELFCRCLKRSGTRPVLWPVVGPRGIEVTRSYPVGPIGDFEKTDHVHHRSVWIGYEGVNGVDFWHEPETHVKRPMPIGTVVHREFVRADSTGDVATIGSRNDWTTPDGRVVAHDQRLWEFRAGSVWRTIDCTLDLWSSDGPLVLGDTKEGFFAVRVAGAMKVDAKQGGKILNSRGDQNADAWGRPAEWVDYSGVTEGATAGITIFAHPSNTNASPRWHVRPYGLFAANPFGVAPYLQGDKAESPGGIRLEEGQRIRLRYRILLHNGKLAAEDLDDIGRAFRKGKSPVLAAPNLP